MPVPHSVVAHDLTLSERVAADLRSLANLAASHPEFAELLAETVSLLFLVLNSDAAPESRDEMFKLMRAAGAVDARDWPHGSQLPAVEMPAGTVRIAITSPWGRS
jgi:hypothetical protein